MERANHINIAMIDDIDTNGTGRSKAVSHLTAVDQNKQPCGSTVSFHNIQYKVQQRGGFFCKRKSSAKEILADLKLVLPSVHPLFPVCLAFVPVFFVRFFTGAALSIFGLTHKCSNCCSGLNVKFSMVLSAAPRLSAEFSRISSKLL